MAVDLLASVFVPALGIGLSIAAPVGPIGLLVIERTLRQGFATGLATGLGAAVADALYGAVGALGVVTLVSALQAARLPLILAGSLFLLVLAWRTWRSASAGPADPVNPASAVQPAPAAPTALGAAFAGTVLLTLANPATVLSFVAIFGALAGAVPGAVPGAGSRGAAGWMVAGVFTGSALWWLLLAAVVAAARHRVGPRLRRAVGRVSAAVLAGFALVAIGSALASAPV